jgi:hypothetical protein
MRSSKQEIKEFFGFSDEGMEHFMNRPSDAFTSDTESSSEQED